MHEGRVPLHTLRADIDYVSLKLKLSWQNWHQSLDLQGRNSPVKEEAEP